MLLMFIHRNKIRSRTEKSLAFVSIIKALNSEMQYKLK